MNGYSTSVCTPTKDAHFREILRTHLRIAKSIIRRYSWANPKYHYWDLNAGPGIDFNQRVGSPLEFISQANEQEIDYQAWFFERERKTAERLMGFVGDNAHVMTGDHNILLPPMMTKSPNMFGLIYCDPSGNVPSFDLLGQFSQRYRLVDILIYISSANIKRGLMSSMNIRTKRLSEYMGLINKKFWIVRQPQDKHQWTFLLATNWTDFPVFESIGFHRMDSAIGKEIMHRLNTTNKERKNGSHRRLQNSGDAVCKKAD